MYRWKQNAGELLIPLSGIELYVSCMSINMLRMSLAADNADVQKC